MAYIRKMRNKWQAIVRKKNYPHVCRSFFEKSTASKWAKDVETQMDRNIYEDFSGAAGTTPRELIEKYRDEVVVNHKAVRSTTSKLNLLLRHKICFYNLVQLKSSHVYKLKKELSVGRAPKTVNIYLQLLIQIWNTAKRQWSIVLPAQSPFELVTLNKINNERDVTLTDSEYERLLDEAAKTKLNVLPDMIRFASITAARYSEITDLLKSNVDFNKKLATFIETKTTPSHTIPLHDDAVAILKKQLKQQPFSNKFFHVSSYGKFENYFNKARRAAGLNHFRFHDLRSRAIKAMLLSGMSEIEVAAVSNHKTLAILHRRYSRIKAQDLLEKVNNVVNFGK